MLTIHFTTQLDRAISYGESCFETVAAIDGALFDWPRHLARLATGCDRLAIPLKTRDLARITAAAEQAIGDHDRIIRLTISPGEAEWGLTSPAEAPRLWVQHQPRTPRPPARLISMEHPTGGHPIEAKFSSDYSMMLRHGGRTILQRGAMPLLWHHGRLCSAASANIALHHDGRWLTPDTEPGGVLPGVIRHHLVAAGLLHPCRCDRATLAACDAIVLLNSGALLQEVAAVDGRPLAPSPATAKLTTALHAIIREQRQ